MQVVVVERKAEQLLALEALVEVVREQHLELELLELLT
jgi:hypothetical protein